MIAAAGFVFLIAGNGSTEPSGHRLAGVPPPGFTFSVLALMFTYGAFFASLVIIPQWLQSSLGYTATWAGWATATNGMSALIMAPIAATLCRGRSADPRLAASCGSA